MYKKRLAYRMNAREFIWGLSKAQNFSTKFMIKIAKNEWILDIPKEPIMTVSKTTNSNLEQN